MQATTCCALATQILTIQLSISIRSEFINRNRSKAMDPLSLDAIQRDLFTAVVGDVLDSMGYLHQFLPPYIQPLRDDMVLIGRAMTVQHRDVSDLSAEESQSP